MRIKGIVDEDFVNYKKPSMFIAFPNCTFKCEKDCGVHCCQNSELAQLQSIEIPIDKLCERYVSNNISQAIVCGGLEPMDDFEMLFSFIYCLRTSYSCKDDVVIYTGYTEDECIENKWIEKLCNIVHLGKIIIKFGRYIPNQSPHYDDILGINLASNNQYAKAYMT